MWKKCEMFVTEKKSRRRREEDARSIIEDKEDEKCLAVSCFKIEIEMKLCYGWRI